MAHGADHEQETQRVADEARNADEDAAGEDHKSVEQLPRRNFAAGEAFLGVKKHSETDTLHDEGSQRADADQDEEGQEEANLVGNCDESGYLCADEYQDTEEDHTEGYRRAGLERPR
jgi:hypothetical protein